MYRCKSVSHSRNGWWSLSIVEELTGTYEVYGNDKGKYKHSIKFKSGLELYKLLTKIYILIYTSDINVT